MQFFFRIFVLLLVCFLSLVTPVTNASTNDQPLPSSAKKISVPGIHNAGKINEHLYRGSQPKLAELSQLKKLGVTTIIDLRAESPQTAKEERLRAEALGMGFVRIPIGGFSSPTNADLLRFFQIIRDAPPPTVFVHCEYGKDRTGVMIAAYRIAFDHWPADQAISEMMQFGFNRAWHPSMITFIRNLPAQLQSDTALKKFINGD